MLTTDDAYARSEAVRLVFAVVDDDEATVEQVCADAPRRADGPLGLLLATARLAAEGAEAAAGPRWREALHMTGWAATPDAGGEL